MLVLARKDKETIRIGESITITIFNNGKRTRVGVDAPRDVRVVRGELDARDVAGEATKEAEEESVA